MSPDFPKSASPTEVWNSPTRKLTGIDGQARTDIVGSDFSFEASAGARAAKIDNLDATVSTRALESGGRLGSVPAFIAPTESSVVMDGTEKTLFEITDTKSSEVEAWVDLTPMAGGDTVIIRYSKKLKAAGAYVKYAEESYSGVQSIPALCILNKKVYRDIKVTATQTAIGVYRTLDIQVIRAKEA